MLNVKIYAPTKQSGAVCGNAKNDQFWVGTPEVRATLKSIQITVPDEDWDQ